jgi:hypothetical protein
MRVAFVCYIYCLGLIMSQQQADAEYDYTVGVEPEEIHHLICDQGMAL